MNYAILFSSTERSVNEGKSGMKYQRIRDLREDRDMTQAQMGAVLHMSQRAYSFYETDQRRLTAEVLAAIATEFDTSVDYLLNLTDEKKPYPKKKDKGSTAKNEEK